MAHDKGGVDIAFQLLLWPALNTDLETGSYRAYGEGRFLPRAFMEYGWDHYAPTPTPAGTATSPRCEPRPSSSAGFRRR